MGDGGSGVVNDVSGTVTFFKGPEENSHKPFFELQPLRFVGSFHFS